MNTPRSESKPVNVRVKTRERMLGVPVGFHVLLALTDGPAHGAEITRRIIGNTVGRFVGGTSLYDEIRALEKSGLVLRRVVNRRKSELDLTEEGERVLKFHAKELSVVVDIAKRKKLC